MNSGQERNEMEKVTGFRSRYTCVFYLGRNKSERGVRSFCFYSECSFFWPSVIAFPSFSPLSFHSSFLPSVSFSFIRRFLLTHTCTIELEHDVQQQALIKLIQEQMFFSASHIALSLTYFLVDCLFLIFFFLRFYF